MVNRDGSKDRNREESEMRRMFFKARRWGATESKIFFNCCILELNCADNSLCLFGLLDDCFFFREKLIFLNSLFEF